jgi:choice-of-anchor A domain-containing protein
MTKSLNACALLVLLWAGQSQAAASVKTWTLDGDFDTGVPNSVNHDAPNNHQLQLNTVSSTEPYIWIANYTQDTVTKLDTRTGKQVAKYHSVLLRNWDGTAPSVRPIGSCNFPSLFAVDVQGNAFVVNQGLCTNDFASVTKYASTLGSCVDRNNNGAIDTSSDVNNNGIIEMDAQEFLGQADECILWTKNYAGPGDLGRSVAVDSGQNLWVGGFSSSKLFKLNGETGALLRVINPRAQTGLAHYIFGITIGPGGFIYTSDIQGRILLKVDPSRPAGQEVVGQLTTPYPSYGIAVDKNGIVFLGSWDDRANLIRADFPANKVTLHGPNQGGCNGRTRGVAVDTNGEVWTSCYSTNRLLKFNATGTFMGSWPVGSGPVGTAVDADGKIWTVNQGADTATRFDPLTSTSQSFPTGGSPYSHSDLTGFQHRNFTLSQGHWTVTHDAGQENSTWDSVLWNREPQGREPANTSVTVEARASNTQAALATTAYVQVANGQPIPGLKGRFIQLRATLRRQVGGTSPVLSDLSAVYVLPTSCIQVELSDYNLFVLKDYNQGAKVAGKVAAGGTITLNNFSVGHRLSISNLANALVAGGNLRLTHGGVRGAARYGGTYETDATVSFSQGSGAQQGAPIDFAVQSAALRQLSSQLASLEARGTTTIETSGGIVLEGTRSDVNVFQVPASAFSGATLLSIEAPPGSLAVINISGTSATLSGFGQAFSGGIDPRGVLYNFTEATSISANRFVFLGTVLAPRAQVHFSTGSWEGGMYALSLTGSAEGKLNPLYERDICP